MTHLRWFVPVLMLTIGLEPALAGGPEHGEEIAQKLGLDDAHRAELREMLYKSKSARIAIEARQEAAELDLHHAMMATTLDEKAVGKALDALNAASADLRRNRVDRAIATRKLLTPEQWRKLGAMWHDDDDDDEEDDDRDERPRRGPPPGREGGPPRRGE